MITILGGTFAFLHPGHKALLKAAADTGNKVVVGLTTDAYLETNKRYGKIPFEERKKKVAEYLESLDAVFEILPLDSREGNSRTGKEYSCIVVSKETRGRAVRINQERVRNGLQPMEVLTVPFVLAEDLFPISSTRILSGEIDENGKRLTPVRISVATHNPLKIKSVETLFGSIMSNISVYQDVDYRTEVEQPMVDQTLELANERALFALKDFDYALGIESGLFRNNLTDTYFDFHCAVLIDKSGKVTTGFSSGFQIPHTIIREVKRGLNLTSAAEKVSGVKDIGYKEGLVGELSGGKVKRQTLIDESVRNALVPRMTARDF